MDKTDVGIELNVTRRPFSFHGAEIASNEDQSWAWGDGLSIYAGDMVIDKLRQFIPHAQMLRDDPMRALQVSGPQPQPTSNTQRPSNTQPPLYHSAIPRPRSFTDPLKQ